MRADDLICAETRSLLSDFVDGETSAAESARVQSHLSLCAECASHLAFLRVSKTMLSAAYPAERSSANLSARIAQATYARPTLGARIAAFFQPAPVRLGLGTALAASVAAAIIVPGLNRPAIVSNSEVAQLPSAVPSKRDKVAIKPSNPVASIVKQAKAVKKVAPAAVAKIPLATPDTADTTKRLNVAKVEKPKTTKRATVKSATSQVAKVTSQPLGSKKPVLPKTAVQTATISPKEQGFVRTELAYRHTPSRGLSRPTVRTGSLALPTPTPGNMPLTSPEIVMPEAPRVAAVPSEKPEATFSPATDTTFNRGRRAFNPTLAGAGTGGVSGGGTTIAARLGRQNTGTGEGASYTAFVTAPVK